MAYMTYCALFPLFCHIFFFMIVSFPPNILSQNPTPTTMPCTSSLFPLLPCAPFVQGTAPAPGTLCCDNLKQLYGQRPHCLCLLFNGTTFTSFPINRTLALQIPTLCSLQVHNSACPAIGEQILAPPTSPNSTDSSRTKNNSTVAASPVFSVPPRSGLMGYRFGRSEAIYLKAKNGLIVVVTITIFLFTLVPY